MPTNDTEPRYQLLDSGGNVVGSLYVDGSGNVALQEGTNQNEATLSNDGTFDVQSISIDSNNFVSAGDFVSVGPTWAPIQTKIFSTTSTSYDEDTNQIDGYLKADLLPSGADIAVMSSLTIDPGANTADFRLYNTTDGKTVWELTGISSRTDIQRVDTFQPDTVSSLTFYRAQIRSGSGGSVSLENPLFDVGIQL